ncbi:MAG: hypothetical protein ABIR06_23180 [Cyclobacteriaceae bacterium]
MKMRDSHELSEPFVKGLHLRYFITAVAIAFFIAAILMGGFLLILNARI